MRPRRATPPCSACWRLPPRSTTRLRRRPTAPLPPCCSLECARRRPLPAASSLSWRRCARSRRAHKPGTRTSAQSLLHQLTRPVRIVAQGGPMAARLALILLLLVPTAGAPQQQDDRGKILLTIFLRHDQSKRSEEHTSELQSHLNLV